MELINKRIKKSKIAKNYLGYFETFAKAVVDIEREIITIDAELHSDLEAFLLENDSQQENLWGINLYPMKSKENFIEYTSLINIRPHMKNFSMEIEKPEIIEKIKKVINNLIDYDS